jgi:acyl carrier protein
VEGWVVDRIAVLQEYLVNELAADPEDVADIDLRLVEEQVIDSLGIFSLVDFIEARFGIAIQPEDITIENFSSLRAIDALVDGKRSEGA